LKGLKYSKKPQKSDNPEQNMNRSFAHLAAIIGSSTALQAQVPAATTSIEPLKQRAI
jgi:hypothetical protein